MPQTVEKQFNNINIRDTVRYKNYPNLIGTVVARGHRVSVSRATDPEEFPFPYIVVFVPQGFYCRTFPGCIDNVTMCFITDDPDSFTKV